MLIKLFSYGHTTVTFYLIWRKVTGMVVSQPPHFLLSDIDFWLKLRPQYLLLWSVLLLCLPAELRVFPERYVVCASRREDAAMHCSKPSPTAVSVVYTIFPPPGAWQRILKKKVLPSVALSLYMVVLTEAEVDRDLEPDSFKKSLLPITWFKKSNNNNNTEKYIFINQKHQLSWADK